MSRVDKSVEFMWKMVAVAMFVVLTYVCLEQASNACEVKRVIFKQNGSQFETNSFTWNNRMVVPLRTITERFNVCIVWNDAAQEATIRPDSRTTITFDVDNNEVYKNGELLFIMDVAPIMRDGRMFIPIRYAVESLGKYMQYYEDTCVKVVSITDKAPTQDVIITKVKHTPAATQKAKLIAKKGDKK